MRRKHRDILNKKVGAVVAVVAGVATIVSLVLFEIRRPDDIRENESRVDRITTAISDVVAVAREVNSNEGVRIKTIKKAATALESRPNNPQMWNASIHVSGARNVVRFVPASGNVGIPRKIGGTKTNKVVSVPEDCCLSIQVSGAKNEILIDESLRSHVSVSGIGAGCSASWVRFGKGR